MNNKIAGRLISKLGFWVLVLTAIVLVSFPLLWMALSS